ncbi:MAG TPA: acyl carrier protein [Steroidobacteraceae bacterium]
MTDQEILAIFNRILRDLLDDDSIVLDLQTVRSDVANWDSLTYVSFIAAAELQLGVKFRIADIESFSTVGDIVRQTKVLLQKSKP